MILKDIYSNLLLEFLNFGLKIILDNFKSEKVVLGAKYLDFWKK